MSWDSYIDSVMGNSKGACDQVAFIGLATGATWTSNAHANALTVTPAEAVNIATALRNEDSSTFQTSGIIIGGVKYQFLRDDWEEGLVLGKKKDHGAVVIHKAQTVFAIAHTAEGKASGDVNKGVATIIEYLKGLNM